MTYFPQSFVDPIIERLEYHLPDHNVVPRSLGMSEGSDSIGVFPATWRPMEETVEMGARHQGRLGGEPTLNFYSVKVQNLRIDGDEEAGRAAFTITSKKIRAILYRDNELHVALRSLTDELLGVVERAKKMDVMKQDFLDSMAPMGTYFLCTTEIVFTTESTPTS